VDAHVQLNVPPEADTAKLLHRHRRWGVYYRSLVSASEAVVEFHQIDADLLVADDVDPGDAGAVAIHVEHRLEAAGFDTTRLAPEGEPVTAGWDIRPRDPAIEAAGSSPATGPPTEATGPSRGDARSSNVATGPSTEATGHFALLGAGLRPPRRSRR